ncbi:6-phosphogluconate dehydrogenase [Nitzschia inconspicua]|uniref:Multifunctional fusion protein n=1 Tax=Nitzschia inconspicua TaxID=303405 RepID=A0A9K3KRC3_9STRA|nr:6-phosphogluconate dehydrogenase [Nitzschia inconspicua]
MSESKTFMKSVMTSALEGETDEQLELWLTSSTLSVVVVGASGDLAKKKTFPSLLNLFADKLLPSATVIFGYARSNLSDNELHERIKPYLVEGKHPEEVVDSFLKLVRYQQGSGYGDENAFQDLSVKIEEFEFSNDSEKHFNRLFYFAIPPNVFAETALAIKKTCMQGEDKGWSRLIVEKPFGRDLKSFEELNKTLSKHFTEDHLYRIDHYLGKEMAQNLMVLRFSNTWFERVWNADNIKMVMLTFKEPFGTEGRGGYFDKYGIIRDILQNHLLQVMTLLTCEPPTTLEGNGAGNAIRDAKVHVLKSIPPIELEDCILGQYEGYADDPTIENKDTNTPTFAVIRLKINNPRWAGVPIILKAGKALNERKAEMRIQFKDAPAAEYLFAGKDCPRDEIVFRLQPHESIYLKTNVKSPGFSSKPVQSEMELNYNTRFWSDSKTVNPDAYTRLILDVLQGKQASFVRDDELRRAWEIFTPLLHKIDNTNVKPIKYIQGSRGPVEADEFVACLGYSRNENYVYYDQNGDLNKVSGNGILIDNSKYCYSDDEKCDVGLYGLAVMGQNFALNMASHGFKVCVGNRSSSKVDTTVERAKNEGNVPVVGAKEIEEFIARLSKPRKVIILVQAGKPVDQTISKLSALMEPGDIIIDGGNEWFPNSIRRAEDLTQKGIHFIGMGISGGEEGARNGPSLMPGGPKQAYDLLAPIFEKCAAQVSRTGPCVGYLGPIGSGNYVKTVHNGIEYGDMQLIAEVYDVMKTILKMDNEEIADQFAEWNKTELDSYLIEITEKCLRKKDDMTDGYVVDKILDKAGMKGTGRWTIQEAAERGVAAPTMAAALDTRLLSARKEERVAASKIFSSPSVDESIDKARVVDDLKAALYASKICSYAQGLSLIKAASDEFNWNVDLSECARLWMGGCIIRAKLLDSIQQAFSNDPDLDNLLVDSGLSKEIIDRTPAWRRTVALCTTSGIACPSLCGSLTYFDTYRRERLPASLTQAQRDFFGGHTYERIDMNGRFHTAWTDAHRDIGDVNHRVDGEHLQTSD